jgi:hypothetical protein
VLSIYTVVLEAPVDLFPTLLSNGNLVEETCHNGIRRCVWHDPFPKPSYLFALVAANLQSIDTTVMSQSGQPKLLQVYTQAADLSRANFALESLRRAMQWDEKRFGLELGLQPDILALKIGEGRRAGLCVGIKGCDLRFQICQCRLVGDGHRIGFQIGNLSVQRLDLCLQPFRLGCVWRCRDNLRLWP